MSLACSCVGLDIFTCYFPRRKKRRRGCEDKDWGGLGPSLVLLCSEPEEPWLKSVICRVSERSPAHHQSGHRTQQQGVTTNTTVTTVNQHTLEDVNEVFHKEIKSVQLLKSWFAGKGSNVIKHKIQVIVKSKNLHIFFWQMVTSAFIASFNIFICNCCSFSSSNF